jgi:Protein of unknown function (DUF1353)
MRTRAAVCLILLFFVASGFAASGYGRFVGTVQAEWLEDGRKMRLLKPFAYVDQFETRWDAPAGSIVDGASIPRLIWTLIGGPFEGKYRNASVVHDVECQVKARPWKAVHRMFYNAMRCGKVGALKAKVMFGAVYHFGPRWRDAATTSAREGKGADDTSFEQVQSGDVPEPETFMTEPADFLRLRAYIEANPEIPLEVIESLTVAFLRKQVPEVEMPEPRVNDAYPDE